MCGSNDSCTSGVGILWCDALRHLLILHSTVCDPRYSRIQSSSAECCLPSGNVDFGLNCLCFKLHPLVYGETVMASFLFNAMILGITSFSTVQFVSQAFQVHISRATASSLEHNITGICRVRLISYRALPRFGQKYGILHVLLQEQRVHLLSARCCIPERTEGQSLGAPDML